MEFFYEHFPEIAFPETRVLEQRISANGIPVGRYEFAEAYCTDPTCDCRRVLLFVLTGEGDCVAVIGFGFDPDGPMRGPFLDPMHDQAPYAQALLESAKRLMLTDPAYVARLERHYETMKQKFGKPESGERKAGSKLGRPRLEEPPARSWRESGTGPRKIARKGKKVHKPERPKKKWPDGDPGAA